MNMDKSRALELGELDNMEDEYASQLSNQAYDNGLELGKKAGQEEGYSDGFNNGAKVGSEIGFYRGFTKTWIELLKSDSNTANDPKSARILNKLQEVLDLVDSFPHDNEISSQEKLSDIRIKFKSLRHFNIQDVI